MLQQLPERFGMSLHTVCTADYQYRVVKYLKRALHF